MMDVTAIGASGLVAASQAADLHAQNLASINVPQFTPHEPVFSPIVNGGVAVFAQAENQPGNPLLESLGLMAAAQQYQAAASLVRTGNELDATMLQTIA
jgi:flagellar basal body rod protein FlgG